MYPNYNPDRGVWPLLLAMLAEGMAEHIAIGLDLADSSMWRHYGGRPGLVVLPDQLLPRLQAEGIGEAAMARLSGQNVARCLAKRDR